MNLGIEGQCAFVSGGTAGLGLACAQALAQAGCRVIVVGRDPERGRAAIERLADATYVSGDVGVDAERARLVTEAIKLGPPTILVTNAAGPPTGQFEEISNEAWRRAFDTSVLAALDLARAFLPTMKAQRYGRIINITSFVVKELYPNMSLSNGLRVALTGAMGSMAREVAPYGVTVNGMLPGLMDTGALERVIRDRAKRTGVPEATVKAEMAVSVPTRRLGSAEDFGALCAFLASRQAGYITGQNICVDGGLTKSVI